MTTMEIQIYMRQDIGTPAGRAGGSKKAEKNENPPKESILESLQ
jgi:hypothetical protein